MPSAPSVRSNQLECRGIFRFWRTEWPAFRTSDTASPPVVIQHAVWLYFRFTLSLRDVEEMLAQRGIEVSYETVRCWTIKFGPKIAANLRRRKRPPSPRWHLDEMVSTIGGERVWIWRAVDDEGEVMDMVVQKRRDTAAALTL